MLKSDEIKQLTTALVKAQREIDSAIKDSANPFFKSRYADLSAVIDAIKEPLNKHGISFVQLVEDNVVETYLFHESGEYIGGRTNIIVAKMNDPQAMGSAITYAKRYGLQAIVGLPTADDDGNAASGKTTTAIQEKPKENKVTAAGIVPGFRR